MNPKQPVSLGRRGELRGRPYIGRLVGVRQVGDEDSGGTVPPGSAATACGGISFTCGLSAAAAAGADALLSLAHRRRALLGRAVGGGGSSRLRWGERFWWARVYTSEWMDRC
jgi:hypothetical protein